MKNKSIHLFIILIASVCYSQTFLVKSIIENGPRDKRINMIFLGDGYRITEMEKYLSDVSNAVEKIFMARPYQEYKQLFNVYAIEVPSNESGTDHPGTASDCGSLQDSVFKKDTYFETSFDVGSIHRLLAVANTSKVYQVLTNNFPDYDIVLMVVNHNWYGGSGGSIAVFSTNSLSTEVALHETGHTLAKLSDEYDYGYPQVSRYDGVNVTFRTVRDSIPWKAWIANATPLPTPLKSNYINSVGLFEGAYYTSKGMFRPKVNCKMRDLGSTFCDVCIEQHIKAMFDQIELIDDYSPSTSKILMTQEEVKEFSIRLLPLDSVMVSVEWYIDDRLINNPQKSNYSLKGSSLSYGVHKLSVIAAHSSRFVISDPNKLLQSRMDWSVEVKNPTSIEKENIQHEFSLGQNYPNPFNPTTTISYKVKAASHVMLKVFDLLGREVATLVDEFKQSGNYYSQFNINNLQLPSSVYLYTLYAGEFVQTKKMLLMK